MKTKLQFSFTVWLPLLAGMSLLALSGCVSIEVVPQGGADGLVQVALLPAAATAQSAITQVAIDSPTPTLPPTQTAPPSATPLPPTQTESSIASPTSTPLPATGFLVRVVNDTRCRSGPSGAYPLVGYLIQDEQVVALGRSPSGSWWLVEKESFPSACWAPAPGLDAAVDPQAVLIVTPSARPPGALDADGPNIPRRSGSSSSGSSGSSGGSGGDPYPRPPTVAPNPYP